MSPLLILAAGFFEDFAFAAGEAVAAVVLDFFEDFIHGLRRSLRPIRGHGL